VANYVVDALTTLISSIEEVGVFSIRCSLLYVPAGFFLAKCVGESHQR
jgi:hypothetical protein